MVVFTDRHPEWLPLAVQGAGGAIASNASDIANVTAYVRPVVALFFDGDAPWSLGFVMNPTSALGLSTLTDEGGALSLIFTLSLLALVLLGGGACWHALRVRRRLAAKAEVHLVSQRSERSDGQMGRARVTYQDPSAGEATSEANLA